MKFTDNIICNNCTGSRLYQKLDKQFNNPFQWCVIQPEDMDYLMQNWDNINFLNYETKEGVISDGKKDYNRFYTLIDNKVKVWWVHYIQDKTKNQPFYSTTNFFRNGGDVYYKDIKTYINEKYQKRLERMTEKPTFVISDNSSWNFSMSNMQLKSKYSVIIASNNYQGELTNCIIKSNEDSFDIASKLTHLFIEPKYSVLTYIIGNYENVHEIQVKDPDVEYVMVTDNPAINSKTWNVVYDESLNGLSTFDKCYKIRFKPFEYVHSNICLRIDGSIEIKKSILPLLEKFNDGGFDIGLTIHPTRNTLEPEYQQWIISRDYPLHQANKCMNFADLIGNNSRIYKGLYQMNFELMRNSETMSSLNEQTLQALRCLGSKDEIERLDQTIFSAIFNQFYENKFKCMWFGEDLVHSSMFQWYLHNSDTKHTECNPKIKKYAFNKPVTENIFEENGFIPSKTDSTPFNARIFILGYKQFDCPVHNKDLYSIVNLTDKRTIKNTKKFHYDVPIIYTDKGDSISDRNNVYDEWTGIYWLWKNYDFSDLEYVGLCQYRRYFEFLDNPASFILKDYELITGGYAENKFNNTVAFSVYHNIEDLKALGRYISNPEDIQHTVKFLSSNIFYPSNILLMKKELFFEFCEFVFGYIFKYQEGEKMNTIQDIEDRIKANPDAYPSLGRSPEENLKYQRQVVAFLMERLTNIWITKYNESNNIMRVSCIETEHTGQGIFKYKPVDK